MSLGQMYEVVLFGDFAPDEDNFKSILNRFTLNTESCEKIHYREVLFEPVALAAPRNPSETQSAVLLRCRQDILERAGTWTLYTYLKAEPIRQHPEVTIRPAVNCQVLGGDALAFASALGYRRKAELYKRGYLFKRGAILILLYQNDKITESGDPEHDQEGNWQVEVKSHPMPNQQNAPLSLAVDAVVDVANIMKGLIDLERRDV